MAPADGMVAARERLREAALDLQSAVGARLEYEHAQLGLDGKPRVLFRDASNIDAMASRHPQTFSDWVESAKQCERRAFERYVRAAELLWILERGFVAHDSAIEVST